jgi:Uma2 family endonuclease
MEVFVESIEDVAEAPTSSGLQTHRSTYAEYRALDVDDNFLYELLNGKIVKKSVPSPFHQQASGNFYFALRTFVQPQKLGIVLYAPIDVFVDDANVLQPNVLFVREERRSIVTSDGVMGSPDLVVEVISPSSVRYDRVEKMKLYRRVGVQEYWLIDPNNRTVEVYHLTPEGYDIAEFAVEEGDVKSSVCAGFSINARDVFAA